MFFCLCWNVSGLFAQETDPCNNAVTPRNGQYTNYFQNGKIESKTYFVNGRAEGTWVYYYPDGTLKEERNYRYNSQSGKNVFYYPSGKIRLIIHYLDGEKNGEELLYYENGQIASRQYLIPFVDENKNRLFVPEDTATYWHTNGTKNRQVVYRHGTPVSTEKVWYSNGVLCEEIDYVGKTPYSNGIHTVYAANGKQKEKNSYKNHERNGRSWQYDTITGNCIKERYYFRNELHGDQRLLDKNGMVIQTDRYYFGNLLVTTVTDKAGINKWSRTIEPMQARKDRHKTKPIRITGTEKNGIRYYETITDERGKKLISNGNGYFEGLLAVVGDIDDLIGDTLFRDINYRPMEHETRSSRDLVSSLSCPFVDGDGRSVFGYQRYAEGKIRNGLKTGFWKEGILYLVDQEEGIKEKMTLDTPFENYATGNYVNGKREGHWEIRLEDRVFEGNFINGKQEGKWRTRFLEFPEFSTEWKEKEERLGMLFGYERIPNPLFVEGEFKNGRAEGNWKIRFKKDKLPLNEIGFNNGLETGYKKIWYRNGNPSAVYRSLKYGSNADSAWTPAGDLITPELIERRDLIKKGIPIEISVIHPDIELNRNQLNVFCEMKSGVLDGLVYLWDIETGAILLQGYFKNGKADSTWKCSLAEYLSGETRLFATLNYKNGILHGYCSKQSYYNKEETEGYYENGKKTGTWKVKSPDRINETIIYRNDSTLLWEREENGIKQLTAGSGQYAVRRKAYENENTPYMIRYDYARGALFKITTFYDDTTVLKEVYKTDFGDSVAQLSSKKGSQCVQNGYGSVSDYDAYGQKTKTTFYEEGYVQKEVLYYQGKQTKEVVFFPSKLNVLQPDTLPYIARTVVQQDRYNVFIVTEVVHNVPPAAGCALYVKDYYLRITAMPGDPNSVSKAGKYYRIGNGKRNDDGTVSFTYCLEAFPRNHYDPSFAKTYSFPSEYAVSGQKTVLATFDSRRLRIYLR